MGGGGKGERWGEKERGGEAKNRSLAVIMHWAACYTIPSNWIELDDSYRSMLHF